MAEEAMKKDIPEIALFDPTKKKKKRTAKVVTWHDTDDPSHSLMERVDTLSLSEGAIDVYTELTNNREPVRSGTLSDFTYDVPEEDLHVDTAEKDEVESGQVQQSRYSWEGTERDYQYKELLQRIFSILPENSRLLAGDRRRTVLKPSQVLPQGTTHTVFANFLDLCKTMHREPGHAMTFLLTELHTTGSLDGEVRLVLKGRFAPKRFADLLQRYVGEYVLCKSCRSPDTVLSRQNKIILLQCEMCGSEQSVASVLRLSYSRCPCSVGRFKHKSQ